MNPTIVIVALLAISWTNVSGQCTSLLVFESSIKGNMTLELILPLRTSDDTFEIRYTLPLLEVFKFAVNQGNEHLSARNLNFAVGYRIHDNCRNELMSTEVMTELILGNRGDSDNCECVDNSVCESLGIVGPLRSGTTVRAAQLASAEVIPMIGFSATSVTLSDKGNFPYFQRTIPPDDFQAQVITDFIKFHDWKLVTILASDDEFSKMGIWSLAKLLRKADICIAVNEVIGQDEFGVSNVEQVIKMVQEWAESEVVVLWMYAELADIIFDLFEKHEIFGKTLIASDGIGKYDQVLQRNPRVVQGMFVVTQYGGDCVDCLEHFWNVAATGGLESYLKSFPGHCHASTDVAALKLGDCKTFFNFEFVPYMYDAVGTYFSALTSYLERHKPENRASFFASWNRTTFFHEYLTRPNFTGVNDLPVVFDGNGDPVNAIFRFHSVQHSDNRTEMYYKHVGTWARADGVTFVDSFTWASERTEPPRSSCSSDCRPGFYKVPNSRLSCCWECWQCSDGYVSTGTNQGACSACPPGTMSNQNKTECIFILYEHLMLNTTIGSMIVALAITGCVMPALIMTVFFVYRRTPVVRSSQILRSFIQLLSHASASASLVLYTCKPDAMVCTAQATIIGACFTTSLAMTAVKTEILVRAFKAPVRISRRNRRKTLVVTVSGTMVLLLVQAGIILTVNMVFPCVREVRYVQEPAVAFAGCNTNTLTSAQIAFLIVVSAACGVQAYRARKLPCNYSEARFIAYAMFVFSVTLCTWIPLNYSLSDVRTKSLISSVVFSAASFEILFLMYGSKLRIIFRKPERNTSVKFRETRMKAFAGELKTTQADPPSNSWTRSRESASEIVEYSDIESPSLTTADLVVEIVAGRRNSNDYDTRL